MGNRAVVTIANKLDGNSVGIYLHWNGGAESVLAFAEAARVLGCRCQDETYGVARLAQIIGNFFGGTLSVGVGRLQNLDCNNFDNGLFRARWSQDGVVLENWPDGDWNKAPVMVDIEQVKRHKYWKSDDNILSQVLEKNKMFKEE